MIIAQFYGAKDEKNLNKGLHTAYAFSIIASIFISIIGWFATPGLLRLLKTPEDTIADSTLYLRIYFLGIIFTLIYNMGSYIMRALGDSRRPLYYLIICCILNIILDLVAVVGLGMGIAGAAIATVISQAVSAGLVSRALMKSYDMLRLKLRAIRIHPDLLRSEFRIGLPGGLQSCAYSISNIIIQTAINNFGTDTAAAWAAFGKVDAIFWTITGSFGITIATFAGQNYGARKYDRIQRSVRVCLGMSLGLCGGLLIFLFTCCRPLYYAFTTDPNVVDIGVYMLRTIAPSYVIYIFVEIFSGALRGIGDVLIPVCITMGGVLIIRLSWILFVTPHDRRTVDSAVQLSSGLGRYFAFAGALLLAEEETASGEDARKPGIKSDPAQPEKPALIKSAGFMFLLVPKGSSILRTSRSVPSPSAACQARKQPVLQQAYQETGWPGVCSSPGIQVLRVHTPLWSYLRQLCAVFPGSSSFPVPDDLPSGACWS